MFTVLCKLIMYGVHFSSLVGIFFLTMNWCPVWEWWNGDCKTTHAIAIAIHPFQNVLLVVYNFVVDWHDIAAIETTLWSIEWGVAQLVNNPDIQTRILKELDDVLGKGILVSEPDTYDNKLPYLSAFVKEVLRFHMAIPLLVPHMNLQQAKLAGYDIPSKSKILVNAWWIGNNPRDWEQPEKFMPERFLDGKIEASGNDFRFLPFGVGRRACPGIIIAMPLLAIVLGRLVQSFELLPPPGVKKIDVTENRGQFSLRIATHSTVVCRPRERWISPNAHSDKHQQLHVSLKHRST